VPSSTAGDAQNEKVLQTALAASAAHFLAFGNIDIDHLSLLGPHHGLTPAEAKLRPSDPEESAVSPRIFHHEGHQGHEGRN
jgi:hypothetical protein